MVRDGARFLCEVHGRNDDPSKLEMDEEAELEDYFDGEDGERNEFTSPLSRVFYTSRTLAETLINEHRCAIIIHTFCHFIFSLSVSAFFAPVGVLICRGPSNNFSRIERT